MTADSAFDATVLEASIRNHVAARASGLGGAPRATDVGITWAAVETPPSVRLFRAQWSDRSGERALTGVCIDGDTNTGPLDAIDMLLRRWHESTGCLPKARTTAIACAFLLDADCRHRVVVGPIEDWLGKVPALVWRRLSEPFYVGVDADLPLVFYWVDTHNRCFRVEISRDRNGRIAFESISLQDSASQQEHQPNGNHGG